jgi:hypothetical protein
MVNLEKYIVRKLGSGGYGDAYLMKNGKVLKVTKSKSEVTFFQKAIKSNLKHICKVYKILKDSKDNNIYYIFKEYLTPITDYNEEYIIFCFDAFKLDSTGNYDAIANDTLKILDAHNGLDLNESTKKFTYELKELYEECESLLGDVTFEDITKNNLGKSSEGVLKVFDILTNDFNVQQIDDATEDNMPLDENKKKKLVKDNPHIYIDWTKNYNKSFKFCNTPPSAVEHYKKGLISLVTPENGNAWISWKEINKNKLKIWKQRWDDIQKTLPDYKYKQILKHLIS